MPYFVYRVSGDRKQLTRLEVFEKFMTAKDYCRAQRKAQDASSEDTIRMVYAEDAKEAEGLLKIAHKPSSPTEEWEG